jgi:hypothetical protein
MKADFSINAPPKNFSWDFDRVLPPFSENGRSRPAGFGEYRNA